MQIAHVIAKFSPDQWGGAEEVVLRLSQEQASRGHKVRVFSTTSFLPRHGSAPLAGRKSDAQNPRVRYFASFLPWSSRDLREQWLSKGTHLLSPSLAAAVMSLRRRGTVAHLHLHNSITATAALCCLLRGIPYVLHLHSRYSPEAEPGDGPGLGLVRRCFSHHSALRHAPAVVCPTETQAKQLRRVFPWKKIVAVPNATTAENFACGDGMRFRKKYRLENRAVLLNVGKIYPVKNQLFLLKLLEQLRPGFPNISLVLIGHVEDRSYFSQLQRQISASQLNGNTIILPGLPAHSEGLVDAYAGSDCFLLPSTEEAFPLVVLEAWASGLPVLTSETDGTDSLIETGVNGIVLREFNVGDWAAATRAVLTNEDLKLRLASNGHRAVCTRYSWTAMADQMGHVYQGILGGRRPRGQREATGFVESDARRGKVRDEA